jgi:hypothetical protein
VEIPNSRGNCANAGTIDDVMPQMYGRQDDRKATVLFHPVVWIFLGHTATMTRTPRRSKLRRIKKSNSKQKIVLPPE